MRDRTSRFWCALAFGAASASIASADTSAGRWFAAGSGFPGTDGRVNVLAAIGNGAQRTLFAGGEFTFAGSARALRIARWTGDDWAPVGEGITGGFDGDVAVNAIVRFDVGGNPLLVVGGRFSFPVASGYASNLAAWDGTHWTAIGGTDGEVLALAAFDDGSGPALYAAGQFTFAGTAPARSVAKWDGAQWTPLAAGIDGRVKSLAVFDDGGGAALHAAGEFAFAGSGPASNVAKWDGSAWSKLGTGTNRRVSALAVHDDGTGAALYAAGAFTLAGSASAARVARWSGAAWSAVGAGLEGAVDGLRALDLGASGGPVLVAVGDTRAVGSSDASGVAVWNGSAWAALDPGAGRAFVGGTPVTCDVLDDHGTKKLAVGGLFTGVADVDASNAAVFDGTTWSSMGDGFPSAVTGLASFDDGSGPALYAGGAFRSAFGVRSPGVVRRRDDGSWSAVGGGTSEFGGPLLVFDDGSGSALYSTRTNSSSDRRVIRWNGTSWDDVGQPFNGSIRVLTVQDDGGGPALYAGGFFSSPGNRVARWNGSSWESISAGFVEPVYAMAAFDDGGGPALYFASSDRVFIGLVLLKWDGTQLTDTGTRFSLSVSSLLAFDDGTGSALYASGFSKVDLIPVRGVARWDGAQWIDVGIGFASGTIVNSLAVLDDGSGPRLYAAKGSGDGIYPWDHSVWRWEGAGWSPLLGGPRSGSAQALAIHVGRRGPELWAGGSFDSIDDRVSRSAGFWRDDLATAFRGTVNAGRGPLADVVFVNGSSGGPARSLTIGTGDPLTVSVSLPPAAAGPSPFALYAFRGGAGASTATFVPGLGFTCFPTPLSGGTPRLKATWNNTGFPVLGPASFPSSPAPSVPLSRASGSGRPVRFTLQGIIADPGSASRQPWSVTNAIEVEAR